MASVASPPMRKAIKVVSDDAKILTKLLPNKIKPIKRSGWDNKKAAFIAPLCPFSARLRIL